MLEELNLAIKEEPPLTTKEGGFIKETFSNELQKIKLVEKKANADLLELQAKYSEKTGIKSLKLNGANYNKTWIDYNDIQKGGSLNFEMDSKPNKDFGINIASRPFSFTKDN